VPHIGLVDVVVARRRPVAAQARAIAGDRRGHAQPAVGVGVVGAKGALEQFAGQVSGLGVELAAAVEGNGVGAERVADVEQHFADVAQGRRPVGGAEDLLARGAELRLREPVGGLHRFAEQRPLGTDAAAVGRRLGDAADAQSLAVQSFHLQATADAAVGTDGFTQDW